MIGLTRIPRAALVLYIMVGIANVLAFGYQFVMPRLLRPAEFAILTQLFGILLVESIGTQVVQAATAKLAAQYRARGDEDALHAFARRWLRRMGLGAALPAAAIALSAPLVAPALDVTTFSAALLGVTLFLSIATTFGFGLLQGLGRFVWLGAALIAQAGTRLGLGAALVLLGLGVDGAFAGATLALVVSSLLAFVPLRRLLRAPAVERTEEVGTGETRFFLLAGVVILAYAGLTNIDAVLARVLLSPSDAGAYAGAITLGKVVLFAPVAIGFILLERTARAHERGEDTDRVLYLALGFVLATSGAVAAGYAIAPDFFTAIVVGAQYPATPALVPLYGLAALSYALLGIWNAYFIGRGEMRIGVVLAAALAVEVALLVLFGRDAASMVRIVAGVAVTTLLIAVAKFAIMKARR